MFSTALEVLKAEASSLRSFIAASHSMRLIVGHVPFTLEPSHLEADLNHIANIAPDSTRWRVMEHSLVVGRLYAIYETFCETLLGDWIDFLTARMKFEELPEKLIEYYPHGFSAMVAMVPSPRYPLLTKESLVSNYYSALQGALEYSLNPECLIHHKNNFRLSELSEVFGRCGVGDIGGWLSKNTELVAALSDDSNRSLELIKTRLSDFIQYRNDSSHGSVSPDEILGYDELGELIEFIIVFCNALDGLVRWKMMECLLQLGEARHIGYISEVFRKSEACICTTKESKFFVGQSVFLRKGADFTEEKIKSVRYYDKDVSEFDAKDGVELGLRFEQVPQKGSDVYSLSI